MYLIFYNLITLTVQIRGGGRVCLSVTIQACLLPFLPLCWKILRYTEEIWKINFLFLSGTPFENFLSLSLSLSPPLPPPSLCLCVSLFPINNRQGALSGILQECRYIFLWSFFYSYLLRQYWIVQNTGMRRITTIRWKTDRILQCSHKIVILYYTILYYTILYYIMLYYIKLY